MLYCGLLTQCKGDAFSQALAYLSERLNMRFKKCVAIVNST